MDYRTLYLPVGLPFSGKTELGQILQDTYTSKLHIYGVEYAKESLLQKIPEKCDDNFIFLHAVSKLEDFIATSDVWWNSNSNLTRYIRSVLSFSAQKSCYKHGQSVKIVALDIKVPLHIILQRLADCKENSIQEEELEAMYASHLTEPLDMCKEHIDEVFTAEWINNKLELTSWKVSDKCTLFNPDDEIIANLLRTYNSTI